MTNLLNLFGNYMLIKILHKSTQIFYWVINKNREKFLYKHKNFGYGWIAMIAKIKILVQKIVWNKIHQHMILEIHCLFFYFLFLDQVAQVNVKINNFGRIIIVILSIVTRKLHNGILYYLKYFKLISTGRWQWIDGQLRI